MPKLKTRIEDNTLILPKRAETLSDFRLLRVNTAAKVHITRNPLPLLQVLMEIVKPGGTVLDPFLGAELRPTRLC